MTFLHRMQVMLCLLSLSFLTHPTYSFSPTIRSRMRDSTIGRAIQSPLSQQLKPASVNLVMGRSSGGVLDEEESSTRASNARRVLVQWGAVHATSMIALIMGGGVAPAIADVSDGTALPEGAAQFGRVVRTKLDLGVIAKRVSQAASEMDETEWKNVGLYLRRVYNVSDDMKQISAGFYDPEKKKRAGELIDILKKTTKAADSVTDSKHGPEFLAYAGKLERTLEEFLELLRDVPDEL